MNSLNKQKICLKEFVPIRVVCKNRPERNFELSICDDDTNLTLSYDTDLHNQTGRVGRRHYQLILPKYVTRNNNTFEVLGLLQAEMGKQHDGKIVFCNHEYQLVNQVIDWFHKEVNLLKDKWKWYIKVNINEPLDLSYKRKIEEKVILYWMEKTGLCLEQSYPKKVSYIKNTTNQMLKNLDYGAVIIEKGSNLLSQIIKKLVKHTSQNIMDYDTNEVKPFMRGIIAGESTVEINRISQKYRVHISAIDMNERIFYQKCLARLDIKSKIYGRDKVVISRKENNFKLLQNNLMTLSPEKYAKFLKLIDQYNPLKSSFEVIKPE